MSERTKAAPMEGYHWQNGVYFHRLPDGSVTIRMEMSEDKYFDVGTIPAGEWASIVAHVSRGGGNTASYQWAEWLHGGGEADVPPTPTESAVDTPD